ncbi:MAG TPA: DNA polymerase III subunit delta [Verrucomicrobiae bacterium]|jgi:DNA polymerase-3 subunit delta|nr:DNA polymerase III subunit delta [Verrucomicrobiae bacterium]
MIYTLTGPNSFALQHRLSELVDVFVAEQNDLALERLDGEEADFLRLQEALTSLPFLADKKLVVLRSPSTNKQFVEKFEQLLGEVPETTDVIIVEPKLDKRLSYYKFLKSKTDFRDFPEPDQNGLASWLTDTAKQQNATLSAADARYLVERVGANQQLLSNELEKLLLYDANISRQAIETLTDPAPQSTIFQLLEAAFAGNTKRALQLYAEQRALKVEPPQIIAMLAWQLHVLAIIKAAGGRSANQVAQEAKLNPFVVRKSQAIARQLSLADLKQLISNLLKIDTQTKSVSIDPDEALQYYLIKLS